jgi:pimeloyl-ACP methyl ester carboxylesterase
MGPRLLYLHGFASGPRSTKGLGFDRHFAARGVAIDRLDLRLPSFEHLRLSAMIAATRAAIGDDRDRAVLIGSSLGGLTAARTAERDPRVIALILLAPAFQIHDRWRTALGDEAWDAWRATGWREVHDYTTKQPARVDFGFAEDLAATDVGFPDLRIPTLIMHGTRDDVVPIATSHRFASLTGPHVRTLDLDDGHELAASLPRLLSEADAFLAPYLGR